MTERPIIFSGPMVRAILDGRKTQTRRVVKNSPEGVCPYGKPGERLWVRETWATSKSLEHCKPSGLASGAPIEYRAGGTNLPSDDSMFDWLRDRGRWRPSIHMPRWASRITPNVTSVRVERVQDISNLGAFAEGTPDLRTHDNDWDLRDCYSHLWDSINAKRGFGWDSNPWVWVVGFERVTA